MLLPPADIKLAGAVRNMPESTIANVKLRPTAFQQIFGWKNKSDILLTEEFSKPKIVYPNMTKYMPFVFDDCGFLTNQKCFIITGEHIAFLTAFLNSSIFKFCFRDSFPELQGGTRELSKIFFDSIPVLRIHASQDCIFEQAVHDIQDSFTLEKAQHIDALIYQVYGLDEKDINEIGYIEISK